MKRKFAVLIPAFNEELVIRSTIESVIDAGLMVGLESFDIIVIDDCSCDSTAEIARSCNTTLLQNEVNSGKTRCIKRALRELRLQEKYLYVSLLDADTRVDRWYFINALAAFREGIAVVCGQPKSVRHNWLTSYRALEYAFMLGIYKQGQSKMGVITIAPGCASTYRSETLATIEWHPDKIIAEDADATIQVHRRKLGRIVYEKKAITYTQDPETLQAYARQVKRWYTGILQTMVLYGIPFGCSKLDFEVALITGEALVFSALACLMPLWLALGWWKFALGIIAADMAAYALVAIWFAAWHRRPDIVCYFPLYPIPRFLSCAIFLWCFWSVIVMRATMTVWYKPGRYTEKNSKKDRRQPP